MCGPCRSSARGRQRLRPEERKQQDEQEKGHKPAATIHIDFGIRCLFVDWVNFALHCGKSFDASGPQVAYGGGMSRSAAAIENIEAPFRVDSISKAAAPEGSEGPWFTYVISQGTNTISGVRSGGLAEVTSMVGEMVERLNERRVGKSRPKGKPKAAAS
jgi:hypothetical protein